MAINNHHFIFLLQNSPEKKVLQQSSIKQIFNQRTWV